MSNHFPITPPPELVQQWAAEARSETFATQHLCNQAARWGADQELEACCECLRQEGAWPWPEEVARLRASRRPKPPSLKARAIGALAALEINEPGYEGTYDAIRRAIEQLPD